MAFGQQGGEVLIGVAQFIDFGIAEFADPDRLRLAELIERILRQPALFIDTEPGSRRGEDAERGDLCRLTDKVLAGVPFFFVEPVKVVDEERASALGRKIGQEFKGRALKPKAPAHRGPSLRRGPIRAKNNDRSLGACQFCEMLQ